MAEAYVQVTTTTEAREDAERIARTLVEERLAACVQVVGPIRSTYWWEGKVVVAEEWLCLAKSRQDLYPSLERRLKAMHPYTVPEILATPVVAGNPDYLAWLRDETKEPSDAQGR